MTAVLEPLAPITLAGAEREIRRVVSRDRTYLYIHECATSWITTLVRNPGGRPAEDVLADVATVYKALTEVDLDFFSGEGTG